MGLRDKAKEAAQKAAELANERARQAMAGRPVDPPSATVHPMATTDATKPLFIGTSHDSGRNAQVTLYRDRIERVKDRSMTSLSRAKQDTEVTPVKAVSSVQAKKDGFRTHVTVYASGNNIDFRFDHKQAQAFKDALLGLVLRSESVEPPTTTTDPMDQLRKLGELRDAGLLTIEEFEAKKAALLDRM